MKPAEMAWTTYAQGVGAADGKYLYFTVYTARATGKVLGAVYRAFDEEHPKPWCANVEGHIDKWSQHATDEAARAALVEVLRVVA